jgi:YD repeat-containing protein
MTGRGRNWAGAVALLLVGACDRPAEVAGTAASRDEVHPLLPAREAPEPAAPVEDRYREVVAGAHGPVGLFPVGDDYVGTVYEIASPGPGQFVVTATTAQGIDAGEMRYTLDADGRAVRTEGRGRWDEPIDTSKRRWLDATTAVVTARSRDGTNPYAPCRQVRETYASGHDGDFETEWACLGAAGTPMPDDSGCAIRRYENYEGARRGMTRSVACFDADGAPVTDVEGVHRTVFERDDHGCLTATAFFDAAGAPVRTRDGWASVRYQPSPTCDTRQRAFFGVDGQPVADPDGVQRYDYDVSEGLVVRESRYDVKGRPTLSGNDGAHIVRFEYDVDGDLTSSRLFDTQDRPVAGRFGYHARRFTYTPEGFLKTRVTQDRYGRPVRDLQTGVVETRYVHDGFGDLVEEAYFDAHGRPMPDLLDRVGRVKYERDERGRVVDKSYWADADTPVPRWSGSHAYRHGYDAHGRLASLESLDADGRPMAEETGTTRQTFAYDDADREIEMAAFRDGQPVAVGGRASIRGYHRVRRELDTYGRVKALRYFGPAGEPVEATFAPLRLSAHRVELVRRGARCVEQRFFQGEDTEPSAVVDCGKQDCVTAYGIGMARL